MKVSQNDSSGGLYCRYFQLFTQHYIVHSAYLHPAIWYWTCRWIFRYTHWHTYMRSWGIELGKCVYMYMCTHTEVGSVYTHICTYLFLYLTQWYEHIHTPLAITGYFHATYCARNDGHPVLLSLMGVGPGGVDYNQIRWLLNVCATCSHQPLDTLLNQSLIPSSTASSQTNLHQLLQKNYLESCPSACSPYLEE